MASRLCTGDCGLLRGVLYKGGDLAGRRVTRRFYYSKVLIRTSGRHVAQFVMHTRRRNVIYDKRSGNKGCACTLLRRQIPPIPRVAGSRTLTHLTEDCFHDRTPTILRSFV